ncbi:MAG TPA: flagellar hook-associated protein FlgL [Candidatus Hydrogenedentes bacterium]|nr:flagellar hook-associated protein FlgL [Candidatus Hydrogenedentota bacterium]HPG66644.1 flagellar hook-associated protein FlgL [Candidatus Hydrogenedentota bacterium]
MPTVRVTQGMMVQRTLRNLNRQTQALFKLQDELATGLRVNTPSDDPIAARRAVNTRTIIAKNEQYIRNMDAIGPQLTESTTTLQSVVDSIRRAYELTLGGANGTHSQTQLDAIADELDQVLEGVLAEANHQTDGRYIFGGTRTQSPPFLATRDANGNITSVAYIGNDEYSEIAISDGTTVTVNEPGSKAFLDHQDVFQVLLDIRDSLYAGDQAAIQNAHLGALNGCSEQVLMSMARVGAIQNRIEQTTTSIEDFNVDLEELLSDTVDADYTETIVNLNAQSNAYQAALSAGARVIQPSLLDFLG